ncbi:UNVERIFIED_CONTAM: hypothetical protein Slati_2987500 [Sesamum latifolium]|uniref:Reverse transcriptase zinc-binding domain-containing protein n=1 Tax=Sesamum latifolium TaxID=2727402 RepID=A0AAW2VF80_9LAMI
MQDHGAGVRFYAIGIDSLEMLSIRLELPSGPKVRWFTLLLGPYMIPRNCLILWLAILKRLSTLDRSWWQGSDRTCILCTRGELDTHDHLFFGCNFSRQCLWILKQKVQFTWPNLGYNRDIEWVSHRLRGLHPLNAAVQAPLASLVYLIRMERNQRRFITQTSTPEHTAKLCIKQIRMRLIEDDLKLNVNTSVLFRIWKIPWHVT